jgi:hypothetical protein
LIKTLALSALALAVVVPAGAHAATGMAAMQYYVGSWSCTAGDVGQTPSKATATYTLDSGVLHGFVLVPAQGKMTKPYAFSAATTYDSKNDRYVQTTLDNLSVWSVAYAKPWTGNTEMWMDHASSSGKLTHGTTVRTNTNSFSFAGYPTLTSSTPNFKGSCTRSS